MPSFTWVEPSYFDTPEFPASDQHPDHDVSVGDQLIKDVYDAVRNSPLWEKTALIITYDEHGGFFDHVAPAENIPSPDGIDSTDDPFDFTRLGVRIPTVVVSPWIPKGSVFHGVDPTPDKNGNVPGQYEHSSLAATVVHKLFQPKDGKHRQQFLTKRDAWAAPFDWVFDLLSAPRTDCPTTTPAPPSHREQFPDTLPKLDGKMPISDLQQELCAIVAGATEDEEFWKIDTSKWNEARGADYCKQRMDGYFKK